MQLFGRERELGELKMLSDRTSAGQGALVLLTGEAGIGKSALLSAALAGAPLRVGSGLCYGPGETPPYGPWLEALAELGIASPDLPPPFGKAPGDWSPGTVAAALVHALSAAGGAVIALEDLQWADPESLRLLRALAPRLQRAPVLVLATSREAPFLHDLERGGAHLLLLSRLSSAQVAQLAEQMLGSAQDVQAYAQRLHARTGGHPLFVRELLAATARAGIALMQDLPLPESVQQSIERRLQQLPEGARRILEVAAVIGEHFSQQVLSRALGHPVDETLRSAAALRLIRQKEQDHSFDHALVREALLASISGEWRRELHLRVAEALLAAPSAAAAETIALHLERAGDPRAARYLLLAGDHARQLGSAEQAADLYARAGALAPDEPEVLLKLGHAVQRTERDRAAQLWGRAATASDPAVATWARHFVALRLYQDGDPRCLELMAEVEAAQAALLGGERYRALEASLFGQALDYPRMAHGRAQALAKAGRAPEARALVSTALARLQPGSPRTELLHAQYWIAALSGRLAEAVDLGGLVADEAARQGDYHLAIATEGNRLYYVLLCKADRPAEVDAVAQRLTALMEQARSRYGQSPGDDGLPPLGWYQFLRGDWAGARRNLLGYLERNPHDTDPGIRGFAALLQTATGDLAGARATLAPIPPQEPDEEPSLHTVGVAGYTMRADLCMDEGDFPRALAYLEGAERCLAQRGQVSFRSTVQMAWARYHRQTGDAQQSYDAAAQAVTLAKEPRAFRYLMNAYTLLGEAAADLGRQAEADEALQRAEELAAQCGFPYYVALARLARARALGLSTPTLTGARDTFARLGAAPALAEAEALLARHAPAPRPATRLSDREVEVVGLIARGLTDKEVGARLFISPRTVDNHLRNIFAKVGVNTRSALATYAVVHGIHK